MSIDTRARVVAFDAVIPVGAFETLARSGVTPNIGHTFPGFGNRVTTEDGSVVAVAVPVLLSVLPPPEQAARQRDPGQRESAPDHAPPPVAPDPDPEPHDLALVADLEDERDARAARLQEEAAGVGVPHAGRHVARREPDRAHRRPAVPPRDGRAPPPIDRARSRQLAAGSARTTMPAFSQYGQCGSVLRTT